MKCNPLFPIMIRKAEITAVPAYTLIHLSTIVFPFDAHHMWNAYGLPVAVIICHACRLLGVALMKCPMGVHVKELPGWRVLASNEHERADQADHGDQPTCYLHHKKYINVKAISGSKHRPLMAWNSLVRISGVLSQIIIYICLLSRDRPKVISVGKGP